MKGKGLCYIKPCGWDIGTRFEPPVTESLYFIMTFTDVVAMSEAYFINPNAVEDWNGLLFTTFSSVEVVDNTVTLTYGDTNTWVTSGFGFFYNNTFIVSVNDQGELLEVIGADTFFGCTRLESIIANGVDNIEDRGITQNPLLTSVSFDTCVFVLANAFEANGLTSLSLPALTGCAASAFALNTAMTTFSAPIMTYCGGLAWFRCTSLTDINIPLCSDLGGTVGDDFCFTDIVGQNITLTVPISLKTINGGLPDGDIQYLVANNTVNLIYIP